MNAPNLLSAFRAVCAPVLLVLAWHGATVLFLALFGLGLASDVLDGVLARRLGQESDLGARLDQWADFALWVSLPVGAWWLWPETIAREAPYVILAVVCLLLPTALAWVKYREVPGYHTWSAKLSSVLMGISVPLLLILDLAWPFRVAALFQLVCAIDELGITVLFAECRHDVPSVLHAARLRRRPAPRGRTSADGIRLRGAGQGDLELLFALLRASLGPYVEQTFGPWKDEEQRARFFESTDPATHRVIELGGQPVGCLDVRWLPDEVKLNRILLFPAHQNRGVGTQLVREILSQARSAGLPVRLRVLRVNHPARRFYERLGFVATGETDTHVLMERDV